MGFYCGTGDVTAHLVAVPQTFAQHFGGRRLVLVDTPAIDRISNNNRDPGALGVIRSWLERSYHKHPPIVGIIYMYDISPTWVPRARIVFEHVANKICGSFEPLKNIVLATSHWDSLDDENTGVQKEHEIRGMLQEFTGRGLSFIPIRKKPVDQYAIIDYLLRTFIDRGSTHGSLQIQKEMLSRRQNPETQAAPSIIILLGTTGSGKSTFVNACIPDARAVSSRSGTTNVTFFLPKDLFLLTLPGFTQYGATEVLCKKLLTAWLENSPTAFEEVLRVGLSSCKAKTNIPRIRARSFAICEALSKEEQDRPMSCLHLHATSHICPTTVPSTRKFHKIYKPSVKTASERH
ncbi:hypothetical protein BKA70DRAFT_261743 [Coprinopsis sp. MPI-PUGE-AT-0042]|nr:hypothetical protein BKA70DRAFT_261743 [Coprinopsis sp. MPI-PUGE-AT-0042]